jgi:hypothetical protein
MNQLIKYHKSTEGWKLTNISKFSGRFSGYMLCCGVKEISGLHHYRDMRLAMTAVLFQLSNSGIRHIAKEGFGTHHYLHPRRLERTKCAHMIFTQNMASRSGYGFRFAEFIKKNHLGKVTVGHGGRNPNSENHVIVFVWTLNQGAVLRWWNGQIDEFETYLEGEYKQARHEAAKRRREVPPVAPVVVVVPDNAQAVQEMLNA